MIRPSRFEVLSTLVPIGSAERLDSAKRFDRMKGIKPITSTRTFTSTTTATFTFSVNVDVDVFVNVDVEGLSSVPA